MVVDEELLGGLALGLIPEQLRQQEAELDATGVFDVCAQYADVDVETAAHLGDERRIDGGAGEAELHQGIAVGHPLAAHPVLVLLGHFQVDGGVDEVTGQLGLGVAEEPGHFPLLDQATVADDGHFVTDPLHHVHLVGDEQDGEPQLDVDLLEQAQDGSGGLGVEGRGGLVTQQYLGGRCQGAGDGDALLLAAGELGRIGVGTGFQPDQGQQLVDPGLDLRLAPARQLQREGDVGEHGAGGQQVEVLEDHADLAASLGQIPLAQGHEILTIDDDLALGGTLQQVDATNKGALAGTGGADHPENLALWHMQAHVTQGVHGVTAFTVDFVETDQLNHGFFRANSLKAQGATGG